MEEREEGPPSVYISDIPLILSEVYAAASAFILIFAQVARREDKLFYPPLHQYYSPSSTTNRCNNVSPLRWPIFLFAERDNRVG